LHRKEICGKDFYRVVFSTSFGFVFLSIRSFCPLPPCRLVFDLRAGAGQSTNAAFHAFDVARLLPPGGDADRRDDRCENFPVADDRFL
jgi:hypothetical protein